MHVCSSPRSVLLALLLAWSSWIGCTPKSSSSAVECGALCNEGEAAFSILAWEADRGASALGAPLVMEYGPQGGQHVFLAVEIGVPMQQRLRFSFDYVDDASGDVLAHASWQEDPDRCGMLLESIPLVFRKDERALGHVEMTVTTDGCEWQQHSPRFEALPPGASGSSDAGALDAGTRHAAIQDSGTHDVDRDDASADAAGRRLTDQDAAR